MFAKNKKDIGVCPKLYRSDRPDSSQSSFSKSQQRYQICCCPMYFALYNACL